MKLHCFSQEDLEDPVKWLNVNGINVNVDASHIPITLWELYGDSPQFYPKDSLMVKK